MLTVDEVEQIQRKKVATIIGHVFQLTYAAFFDKLVQEEKVNRCHGCAIQHSSQRQHSCLMLDTEDAWFHYHDEAREQIDLAVVMKTVESVCSALGLKLGQTWERYLTELPKLPWTSLYLTSLELEHYAEDMKERVLSCIRAHFQPHSCCFSLLRGSSDCSKLRILRWRKRCPAFTSTQVNPQVSVV